MKEKHLECAVKNHLRMHSNAHILYIPDDIKVNKAVNSSSSKNAQKKQYDFGVLYNGKYSAVECKKLRSRPNLGIDKLVEPHQLSNLVDVIKCGGDAYMLAMSSMKSVRGLIIDGKYNFINVHYYLLKLSLGSCIGIDTLQCNNLLVYHTLDQLCSSFLEYITGSRAEE